MLSIKEQQKLVEECSYLATTIAAKYFKRKKGNKQEDFLDLQQEGFVGLCHAAKLYNPKNKAGAKFSTYAQYWVHKYVRKMAMKSMSPLKISEEAMHKRKRLNEIADRTYTKSGVYLDSEMPEMNDNLLKPISLDFQYEKSKASYVVNDCIEPSQSNSLTSYFNCFGESGLINRVEYTKIREVMPQLNPKEHRVLNHYLNGVEKTEIARRCKVTKQRVYFLYNSAVEHLQAIIGSQQNGSQIGNSRKQTANQTI